MAAFHDTPTRSRDEDQSMELPTLPSMYPHDSEGDSMLSELSRSQLHQQPNLSISQILSSTPGSYPATAVQSPTAPTAAEAPAPAAAPAAMPRATTPQPDTPLSNNSFHSPQMSISSISTPLTSTPHASFAASRSRLSVLRSGGSDAYSTPRSDPDSTTSSRTRFAMSGPWNQADDSRDAEEGAESFNTPAIHSRMSGGPDSFEFAPDGDDQEAEQDSFAPRPLARQESPAHDIQTADGIQTANDSSSSLRGTADEFQDVDLSGRSREEATGRSFDGESDDDDDLPYVDMPSLEKSFEVPVNFGTPSAASRSRLTNQDLSLVEEEEEEEEERSAAAEDASRDESDKEMSAESRALKEMSSPEMKSTFINLGRRRSNSRGHRSTLPLLQHSPASTSSLSESSAATPNGASQASTRHDSFQVQDDQSLRSDDDDEPAPNEVANITTESLDTPQTRTFRDFSVPIPESNYGTPSPSSAAASRGPLSTPKPSAALELRKNVALAALASSSRPKMRGTPHTRRSSSFVGAHQPSIDMSSTQHLASPSAVGRSYNESLISLGQLTADDSNTSVLSVESAEDLTNLHRANTSLPLSEATPKQGGIKIHKHLHNLNTQLHLRNTTLQEERDQLEAENDDLRRRLEAAEAGAGRDQSMAGNDAQDDDRATRLQRALEESEEELYALRQVVEEDAAKRVEQEEEIRRLEGLDEELKVLREQVDLISLQHESNVLTTAGDRSADNDGNDHDDRRPSAVPGEVAHLRAEVEERSRQAQVAEDAAAAAAAELARQAQAHAHKLQQLESDIEEILKTNQAEVEDAIRQKEEALAQLSAEKAALTSHTAESDQARSDAQAAAAALAEASARIAALEDEVEAARQTNAQREELVKRLRQPSPDIESPDRVKDLEVELSSARLEADANQRAAEHRISDLEGQLKEASAALTASRAAATRAENDLVEADKHRHQLEESIAEKEAALAATQDNVASQADVVERLQEREAALADEAAELRTELLDLGDKLSAAVRLQESHSGKQSQLEAAHSEALAKAQGAYGERIQLLEEKLHEARSQTAQDQHTVAALSAQLDDANVNLTPRPRNRSPLSLGTPAGGLDAVVEDLHEQLHAAHVEIGRLQADLASSPYKRAAIEARDLRIQVLESHKSNIDSQFSVLRRQSRKLSLGSHASFNTSVANQTILSVRTPKSVGPLKKMPWLDQTPGGAPDESLLAEVARLRQQLDDLNELVDDGVDRLRNAGSDQTALARQLSDAKDEVASLQDLLAKMRQNERASSLEHARAQRAKASLQTDVKELNQDLDASRRELSDVKRENATLQEDIRGVTRDFEACKRDLQDAEEHAERLQQLLDRNRAHADDASHENVQEMKDLRQARARLEAQVSRADEELRDVKQSLSAELDGARTSTGALRDEVASQAIQIDQLRRAHVSRDAPGREDTLREIADLQQDLLRTRRDVKSLEEEIKAASRKREESVQRKDSRRGEEENRQMLGQLQMAQASLDTLKAKHRKETQGIFVEVKHLKAVILRESTFRSDLSLQKEYLLILIGQLSRQQARVYAAIAQLGYPHPHSVSKPRSFKSVALVVLMTIRTRNLAGRWSRELETKQALKDAYERVRASRLLQPVRDDQKVSSTTGGAPASRGSLGKADGDAPRRRSSTAHGGAQLR